MTATTDPTLAAMLTLMGTTTLPIVSAITLGKALAGPRPRARPGTNARTRMRIRDVLCVFANPGSETWLRLDHERRAIEEANRLAGKRLRITSCWATRPNDLLDHLLDARPDVIHFAGHGEPGRLLLENEGGRTQAIGVARLLEVLSGCRPRCVLLSACHSAIALRVHPGIPHVIAMQGSCSDEGSIMFARHFYHALARGCTIEAAFVHGCRVLRLCGLDEDCRPRLLCR